MKFPWERGNSQFDVRDCHCEYVHIDEWDEAEVLGLLLIRSENEGVTVGGWVCHV